MQAFKVEDEVEGGGHDERYYWTIYSYSLTVDQISPTTQIAHYALPQARTEFDWMSGAHAHRLRATLRAFRVYQNALRDGANRRRIHEGEPACAASAAAALGAFAAAGTFSFAPAAQAEAAPSHAANGNPTFDAFPSMESPFLLPMQSTSDRWRDLKSGDLSTALSAAEGLFVLTGDVNKHKDVIDSGVIPALCEALERALEPGKGKVDTDKGTREALLSRSLSVFAELARTAPSHGGFAYAAPLVVKALKQHPVRIPTESWTEWATAKLGLTSDKPDDSVLDISNGQVEVDIGAGIATAALRCLANLASEATAHETLLNSGALEATCVVLRNAPRRALERAVQTHDAKLVEALRFATCTVAGLAKNAASRVVLNGGHKRLIEYCISDADSTTRTYAIAGLRNLSRHPPHSEKERWRVHREVVVAGAPEAIAAALGAATDNVTKQFGTLTLLDLSSSGHHKVHLIHRHLKPAYEALALLLTHPIETVANNASKFVTTTFEHGNESPELADSLASHCAAWVQGPVARGDSRSMQAMAYAASHPQVADALITGGAPHVLLTAVQKGRGNYLDFALQACANLAAHATSCAALSEAGVIAGALKRAPISDSATPHWAALAANAARDPELRVAVAHAALLTLVRTVRGTGNASREASREACRALHNLTVSPGPARVMVVQAGAAVPLVAVLSGDDPVARSMAAAALGGAAEALEYVPQLVSAGAAPALIAAARGTAGQADNPDVTRAAARAIACMATNEAAHPALDRPVIEWIAHVMRSSGGRNPEAHYYATTAACNIAYSPSGRELLRAAGIVPLLNQSAASTFGLPEVLHAARQALANINASDEAPATMVRPESEGKEPLPL